MDALASQINLETEWARKQQKSTDGTLVEAAENWNELIEGWKPEDFYESLRNLIMENLCGDSYFTEDKIHILRKSIEEKMIFLDYSWDDQFDAKYTNLLKETMSALDNHLNREPSDAFKLGKKADLSKRDSVIKSILSKAQIDEQEVSSEEENSTFTGPIEVVKKTPQGISNKRFISRGRGKKSPPLAIEIDENDNKNAFNGTKLTWDQKHIMKCTNLSHEKKIDYCRSVQNIHAANRQKINRINVGVSIQNSSKMVRLYINNCLNQSEFFRYLQYHFCFQDIIISPQRTQYTGVSGLVEEFLGRQYLQWNRYWFTFNNKRTWIGFSRFESGHRRSGKQPKY